MFMNASTKNKLIHTAVPTLFNFPQTSSSASTSAKKRKPPTDRNPVVLLKKRRNEETNKSSEDLQISDCRSPETVTADSTSVTSPRKTALTNKLFYARALLNRARVALHRLQEKKSISSDRQFVKLML